ncbi:MAG: HlyD family efflux transporter periplasmic adaptor subunit [Paraglaciecola sp.]|nr:HlyD family efflux transporter periplasmic adaptor subunit [Paraglaciecola sp.]NCT46443.1 HlyD family efflux transporter periplasmic adaptor subunit [Paraglaciecola sp.]
MSQFSLNKAMLLLVSVYSLSACQSDDTASTSQNVSVISAPAELISLKNATVGPPNVRSMWQFKIERMAPENKLVKEGEVILVFDGQQLKTDLIGRTSELDAEKKRAENEKLNDDAKQQDLKLALAEAEMNYQIAKRKVEIVDVSSSEIDKQKQYAEYLYQQEKYTQAQQKLAHHEKAMVINAQVAQGKIKNLMTRVNRIQEDLDRLTIKAPKDGLVMYMTDWNGDKAAVGETVYMGRSLIQLPSLDEAALKAEFAEPDTAKLHTGSEVKVIFDAYPETAYMGKIAKLGQSFYPKSSTNQKVVFDAQIELGEQRPKVMRPGMQAKVEVVVQ